MPEKSVSILLTEDEADVALRAVMVVSRKLQEAPHLEDTKENLELLKSVETKFIKAPVIREIEERKVEHNEAYKCGE